ncbi:zinc finger Y-chromosomal protein 1-like [Pieris rapae]|uniref:zinc finger Y-chromosomal protein 1-like n=1 Tax=Pieris rapae TaxID=64459 RepID=UPI001E27AE82|nr:zinc finger Y-chromosomal protein 1-like [Pieris rapae]
MTEECCVDGCFNVKEQLFYFKLPVSRTLRKKWVDAINSTAKLTDDAMVCSRHFQEEQYMFVRGKRRLKPKVVPCLFQKESQNQVEKQNTDNESTNELEMDIDENKESTDKDSVNVDKENTDTDRIYTEKDITDKDRKNTKKDETDNDNKNKEDSTDKQTGEIERIDKSEDKCSSPEGSCTKSPRSVKNIDLEFSPNKDIEDILTNYHIKQTRPLSEISERETRGEREKDRREGESEPKYVEISVGGKNQDQTNEDCLMLLENVQVEIDPSMFPLDHDADFDRDQNIEQVDLDLDSSSDCIDLGEKKDDPISLLSSSDEDEVIIQEPHIDTISVSDATDEDDIPLLKLVKRHKKSKKCEKTAAINKILVNKYKCEVCKYSALDAADYSLHMSKHTHMIHMCEMCNYHTSSWLLMHRHKEKHTRESKNTKRRNREKKYKCPLCSYRAKHNMSLVYHMGTHGAKNDFECDKCGYFSNLKENVANHMKNCKSEFSCGYCSYRTGSKSCYSKHLKRFHDEAIDRDFVPSAWT